MYKKIEKKLEALEIIKNKLFDTTWVQVFKKEEDVYVIRIELGYCRKDININEAEYKTLIEILGE